MKQPLRVCGACPQKHQHPAEAVRDACRRVGSDAVPTKALGTGRRLLANTEGGLTDRRGITIIHAEVNKSGS